MPVMSGLEMIENVKNSGFTPHFIILTVYAEFEYARTAFRKFPTNLNPSGSKLVGSEFHLANYIQNFSGSFRNE